MREKIAMDVVNELKKLSDQIFEEVQIIRKSKRWSSDLCRLEQVVVSYAEVDNTLLQYYLETLSRSMNKARGGESTDNFERLCDQVCIACIQIENWCRRERK